jgi:hypothetical protein
MGDRTPNQALERLYRETGWTLCQFAQAVNHVGTECGRPTTYSPQTVHAWLKGHVPARAERGALRFPDSLIAVVLRRESGGVVLTQHFGWCAISKLRVQPFAITEALNIPDNLATCFRAGGEHVAVQPLVLQRTEERFGHGVVPTDAGPSNGLSHAVPGQSPGELIRGVVAAPVGMEYGALLDFHPPGGHFKS